MTPVKVVDGKYVLCEWAQLSGGAAAFTFKTCLGQAGLGRTNIGDLGRACVDLIGDGMEEGSTFRAAAVAIGPERLFGGLAGAVHQIRRACAEPLREVPFWCPKDR